MAILVPAELKVIAASGLSWAGIIVTALCQMARLNVEYIIKLHVRPLHIQDCMTNAIGQTTNVIMMYTTVEGDTKILSV